MYDTVKVALEQLDDDRAFEKVAYYVLRPRLPNLRLTSASADLGMDAYSKHFFAIADEVGVSASLQRTWRSKLADELRKNRGRPSGERPNGVFFTTNQRITEVVKREQIDLVRTQGVEVEIFSFEDLEVDLEGWSAGLPADSGPLNTPPRCWTRCTHSSPTTPPAAAPAKLLAPLMTAQPYSTASYWGRTWRWNSSTTSASARRPHALIACCAWASKDLRR